MARLSLARMTLGAVSNCRAPTWAGRSYRLVSENFSHKTRPSSKGGKTLFLHQNN